MMFPDRSTYLKTTQTLLASVGMLTAEASAAAAGILATATPTVIVGTSVEPEADGKFQPAWESLKPYPAPERFSEATARFGCRSWSMVRR
jgi:hypothetical protein